MGHFTTTCSCHHERSRRCESEDVVEVVVRASDVVEGVHSREGVLLVEGGEGDQSAVV